MNISLNQDFCGVAVMLPTFLYLSYGSINSFKATITAEQNESVCEREINVQVIWCEETRRRPTCGNVG